MKYCKCGRALQRYDGSLCEYCDAVRRDGYRDGVRAAAQFVGTWDRQINHPYRMEDCVLCKFNLRKGKPRRKPNHD